VLQTTFTPILLGVALAHALASPLWFGRLAALLGARVAAPLALLATLALASVPGDLAGAPRLAIHLAMATLVAACVVREDNALRSVLAWPPIDRIGAVSYGIYLYHLIALDLFQRVAGNSESSAIRFAACALVSIAIAEVSYRVLEMRFLELKRRFEARAGR
jgi:peptidoglycan/LPS O-acetylase OafA/YrhL